MQYANKHLNGDVWCVSLVVQSKSHIRYACGAQLSLSVWSQRMRDEVRCTHLCLPKLETPYINSIQFNSMAILAKNGQILTIFGHFGGQKFFDQKFFGGHLSHMET